MDATDLARWARFAAKGGIGRCTAIQDCIAKSPEDLMFLKDDEITVLMQLPPQGGWYLGHCEGVVGRFQGAHVRFHGKLKRPIMTKRSSTSVSAVSTTASASHATTPPSRPTSRATAGPIAASPIPSVPPSPHTPLDSLLQAQTEGSSPLMHVRSTLQDHSREHSSPRQSGFDVRAHASSRNRERDSDILSDPFDLELPPTPPSHASMRGNSMERLERKNLLGPEAGVQCLQTEEAVLNGMSPTKQAQTCDSNFSPGEAECAVTHTVLNLLTPDQGSSSTPTSSGSESANHAILSLEGGNHVNADRSGVNLGKASVKLSASVSIASNFPSHSVEPRTSEPQANHTSSSEAITTLGLASQTLNSAHPVSARSEASVFSVPSPATFASNSSGVASVPTSALTSQGSPGRDDGLEKSNSSFCESASVRSYSRSSIYSITSSPSYRSSVYGPGARLPYGDNGVENKDSTDAYLTGSGLDDGLALGLRENADTDEEDFSRLGMAELKSNELANLDDDGDSMLGVGIGLSMLQDIADEEDEEMESSLTKMPPVSEHGGESSFENNLLPGTNKEKAAMSVTGPKLDSSEVDNKGEKSPVSAKEKEETEVFKYIEEEDDDNDDDDDDDSYWDGADIYDNYRYSRFSLYSRGARRRSNFSILSRLGSPGEDTRFPIPPTDSRNESPVQSLKDRKRNVPPPLTLTHSESMAMLSPKAAPSCDMLSPSVSAFNMGHNANKHSTMESESPLLHTDFPSPHTSSSRQTSVDSHNDVDETKKAKISAQTKEADTTHSSDLVVQSPGGHLGSGVRAKVNDGFLVENGKEEVAAVPENSGIYEDERASMQSLQSRLMDTSVDISDNASQEIKQMDADLTKMTCRVSISENTTASEESRTPADSRSSDSSEGDTRPLHVQDHSAPTQDLFPTPFKEEAENAKQGQEGTERPELQLQGQVQQNNSLSHLCPNISPEQQSQGQMLFLPHPNAPRPNPAVLSGQRTSTYGMPPAHSVHAPKPVSTPNSGSPSPDALQKALRAAADARTGPTGVPHLQTIFGKPIVDLASSDGPVLMMWSLQPFPLDPTVRGASPSSSAHGGRVPRRAATTGASPLSQSVITSDIDAMVQSQSPSKPVFHQGGRASPAHVFQSVLPPPQSPRKFVTSPSPMYPHSVVASPSPMSTSALTVSPPSLPERSDTSHVIPRAKFIPQIRMARPRSRSFSDFASAFPTPPSRTPDGTHADRDVKPEFGRSSISTGTRPFIEASSLPSGAGRKPSYVPLPLTRKHSSPELQDSRTAYMSPLKALPLSSPSGRPPLLTNSPLPMPGGDEEEKPERQSSNIMQPSRTRGVTASGSQNSDRDDNSVADGNSLKPASIPEPRTSSSTDDTRSIASMSVVSSSPNVTSSTMKRLRRASSGSKRHERTISQNSHASGVSSGGNRTAAVPENNATIVIPPPNDVQRRSSLKSRLSLTNLRIKSSSSNAISVPCALREPQQTPSPSTGGTGAGSETPVFEFASVPETVHVQDAEFEMIRPTLRRMSSENINDELGGGDARPSLQSDAQLDGAVAGPFRSPILTGPAVIPDGSVTRSAEDAAAEAHRTRELRWISTMSSVPADAARKSKKVKRLVFEGVPSSVRYLVWAHLTDSKAKRIPGVYGQIGQRSKVSALPAIERDAEAYFPDQPHLRDPKGPLVNLLSTYLTMVPDVEYQASLALVAGKLLIQSPEEDAFWTFVAVMDLHLRSYFSPRSLQLAADSMLFSNMVKSMLPSVARKLFTELKIQPIDLCRSWLLSLFITALPPNYVNRMWDFYFSEGPTFLFRVGIVILSFKRVAIESAQDLNAALSTLCLPQTSNTAKWIRPSSTYLPSDPEEFAISALSVKLKEDDLRKQRVKLAAQLKQQAHPLPRVNSVNSPRIVTSISRPRT